MFAVRECIDHYPSNASSWNESCIHKPVVRSREFFARNMATVKSATAETVTAAMTAEKVVTVKSDVENVAVSKTATEMANTIALEQAECPS